MVPSRVGLRMGGAGYSCALVTTAGAQRPSPAAPARPRPWPGFWPALLAIVAAGVAIRVVYTLVEAPWPPPGLDDQFYFSALPKLLADGHGFVAPFKLVFDHVSVADRRAPAALLGGAGRARRCSGSTRPTPSGWPGRCSARSTIVARRAARPPAGRRPRRAAGGRPRRRSTRR